MRQEQAQQYASVALEDVGRIIEMVDANPNWTAGLGGSLLSAIPGMAAHDVSQAIRALESFVAFDRLQNMRDASPTGGALGAVSDREIALLSSAYGSLSQSQSHEEFMRNLQRFEQVLMEIVHGPQGGQGSQAQAPQAQGGGPALTGC